MLQQEGTGDSNTGVGFQGELDTCLGESSHCPGAFVQQPSQQFQSAGPFGNVCYLVAPVRML